VEEGEGEVERQNKGGDRRIVDLAQMQCNVCGEHGHGWITCPKGDKEMQRKN
jgi:hypothetical protein